ncbi:MAG: hypothetical protein ACLF0G_01550 [Candidatus Brocadiia bacterium]
MPKPTQCPKCSAELPRKGRFCLECGLDLYEEGLRRRPLPWVPILVAAALAGAAVAYLATRSEREDEPPEFAAVRERTREVLRLAGEGDYTTIAARHMEPHADRFEAIREALLAIYRDQQVKLKMVRTRRDELDKLVSDYRAEHPEYIARLFRDLTDSQGMLFDIFAGKLDSTQSARKFLAWYLALAFDGVDASQGTIADLRWTRGPEGRSALVAQLRYPQAPRPLDGVADPTLLPWRLIDGEWVLVLGARQLHLDEAQRILRDITAGR